MLLTILVLSLLLGSLVREGMDGEAIQIVNEDAPVDPNLKQSDPRVTPDGIQLPNQEKPLTVDEISKILGSNQSIQQMLEKKETKM